MSILQGHWPLNAPVNQDLATLAEWSPDQLATWVDATIGPQIAQLKADRGYQSHDIVRLTPQTPNLPGILANFRREHHHTDDEVRVILHGAGIFGIVPAEGDPFTLTVYPGDWLVLPAFTRHWFDLTETQTVIAVRLFKENPQWEAIYEKLHP